MNRPLFDDIAQPEKVETPLFRRGISIAISLAIHAGLLYALFTARFEIKRLRFRGEARSVVIASTPVPQLPRNFKQIMGSFPLNGIEPGALSSEIGGRTARPRVTEQAGTIPGPAPAASGGRTVPPTGTEAPGEAARLTTGGRPGFSIVYPLAAGEKPPKDTDLDLTLSSRLEQGSKIPGRRAKGGPVKDINLRSYTESDYLGRGTTAAAGGSPGSPAGSPHALIRSSTGDKVVYRGSISARARGYDIGPWAQLVVSSIQQNWLLPASDAAKAKGRVGITIIVERTGKLSAVRLINSSNNRLLDRAALDAVGRSLPLPQLPSDFPELVLEAYLLFDYNAAL